MRQITQGSRRAVAVAVAAIVMATAACAESEREPEAGGDGATDGGASEQAGGTFVFAASSDPVVLDPAFASDGETFRVARQIFEGLVGTEPGTADPAPLLAESWETSSDGLSYTFDLKEGVTFHDGTEFNAEAVCYNFDRWYNWEGLLQSENFSYYYQNLFQGFASSDDPELEGAVYESCEATSDTEVTINLTEPFAAFVSALSLPAFSMQSPTALQEYGADQIGGTEADPRYSDYATANPTGTGPFMFEEWDRGQSVTLARYDDYWGDVAEVDQVIIRTISDGNARLQALQSGDIDGYDLVAPGDIEGLEEDGFTIVDREAFNILYLGMNQAYTNAEGEQPLADPLVRQAIAHAVDKEGVAEQSLPEGTPTATQFIPEAVAGWADDVVTYDYDPERAMELLAEAGYEDLTIPFNYPTGVSRPYMPTPEDTFVAIRSQLEEVGITVEPVADQWSPNYLDRIQGTEDHGIHLLGWTGDYNSTDNFLGVFFGAQANEWGFDNPELFSALSEARGLPTVDEQTPAYEEINRMVMEYLPGIPLAHPTPSLAFAPDVEGYQASPVQDEVWNNVTVGNE